MADALDQDVQALKEWIRKAWRHLADPEFTGFERRELRNYMKEVDVALRTGLQKAAAKERVRTEKERRCSQFRTPDFRIFSVSDERLRSNRRWGRLR